jgi:MFS family permease
MRGRKWGPDLAALRHRDFALYISANFLTTIALQIQATALAWQIYAITDDPFQLGLVGLAEFLPAALLALPAGHLADRIDRRLLILIGVTAELFAALTLVILASTEDITEVAILAIALCFGVARAIATPAARALMPNLMPQKHLASAVAWSSTSWQVATIGGPGVGGWLYSGLGGWLATETPALAYGGAALGLSGRFSCSSSCAAGQWRRSRRKRATSPPSWPGWS